MSPRRQTTRSATPDDVDTGGAEPEDVPGAAAGQAVPENPETPAAAGDQSEPEPTQAEWEARRDALLAKVPTDRPAGIYGKLAQLMGLIPMVQKKGRNDFHGYNFAKESDLVEVVRPLLSVYGIFFHWTIIERRQGGVILREGARESRTEILIRFKFIDGVSGVATEPQELWADGDDPIDKGIYKAMTGAVKYALMKTFLIATGDDPEADKAADRRGAAHEASSRVDVRSSGRGAPPAQSGGQRRQQPAPGGRQAEQSGPQAKTLGELLRAADARKSDQAIVLIERLTGDKIPVVMVEDEPDLAGSLAAYLAGLDGPKTGKLIHDLRAHVDSLAQPAVAAGGPEEAPEQAGTPEGGEDPAGLSQMEADAAAEADDLAAGAPY